MCNLYICWFFLLLLTFFLTDEGKMCQSPYLTLKNLVSKCVFVYICKMEVFKRVDVNLEIKILKVNL